eukprot:SAG31_NODE_15484_length_752_cov_3.388974_1_plen_47_part_01
MICSADYAPSIFFPVAAETAESARVIENQPHHQIPLYIPTIEKGRTS